MVNVSFVCACFFLLVDFFLRFFLHPHVCGMCLYLFLSLHPLYRRGFRPKIAVIGFLIYPFALLSGVFGNGDFFFQINGPSLIVLTLF